MSSVTCLVLFLLPGMCLFVPASVFSFLWLSLLILPLRLDTDCSFVALEASSAFLADVSGSSYCAWVFLLGLGVWC